MNPEIKRRWIEALTSGEYEQGTGWLLREDKYCCLGVLCDLAVKDGVIHLYDTIDSDGSRIFGREGDNNTTILPVAVKEWAGLDVTDPEVQDGDEVNDLTEMNDGGSPFFEIASAIEASL